MFMFELYIVTIVVTTRFVNSPLSDSILIKGYPQTELNLLIYKDMNKITSIFFLFYLFIDYEKERSYRVFHIQLYKLHFNLE